MPNRLDFAMLEAVLKEYYKGWEGASQFDGLANRLGRMLQELFWTNDKVEEEVKKCFKAVYEHSFSEMLVAGPTSVWTFCPHHLLPCHFDVYIGYIPQGRILGLSKFSRIATALGRRPTMQEQYSQELAVVFTKYLKPEGLGVYVNGKHGCMMCRGVAQSTVSVSTSILRGIFLSSPDVKKEFFDIVHKQNG